MENISPVIPARPGRWFPAIALAGLVSCSEPFLYFAGGQLGGEETPLNAVPDSGGLIQLETAPADPYSVNLGFTVQDGIIYLDPAESRRWYQNIQADPRVRIRFDGSNAVHPMLAVRETDPTILNRFDPERIILRLEPR